MPAPEARQVFFVHVMKTGGETLLEGLRHQFDADEIYPNVEHDVKRIDATTLGFRHLTIRALEQIPAERRRHIRVFAGHFPLVACEVLGGGLETVTILRDPVDRTVSLLRQLQRPAPWMDPTRPVPLAPLRLEEVYEQSHVFEPLVHNHQTKQFSMTKADAPAGYMHAIHVDGSRLALAKENLARVDVVGLTERYSDLLDLVAQRFGWSIDRDARVNPSPTNGTPVSRSLRQRIAEDNAIDIEFYEHARALVATRRERAGEE